MRTIPFRRSIVLAAAGVLLAAAATLADTIRADGDVVHAGIDSFVEVGPVAPGGTLLVDVAFQLDCGGSKHVDANQTVTLTLGSRTVPTGGNATGTTATINPPGSGWPVDGTDCSSLPSPIPSANYSHVTLTAPPTPGTGYIYTLFYNRTLSPSSPNDSGTFSGSTGVTFSLNVVINAPPVLTVPSNMTVEGNTTGGAHVSFAATATDLEDDPDPSPTCAPLSGSLFSLGTTTVNCTVTDSGGLTASRSFTITVVDTTAPSMSGVPTGLSLVTNDPAGATISYNLPTVTDIVDANPRVSCSPPSGSVAPVGDSIVTCTAIDASGNRTTRTFPVSVHLNAGPVLSLPANRTVEGDTTGGARVTYTATATDAEDNPDPNPTCSPASGSLFGLGTTTVNCTVTDSGGLTASGSFTVKVVDTTAPSLSGGTSALWLTTTDPAGATISYTAPTASDVVDARPSVSCSPPSGSVAPVGDSSVTCTASDASGNVATSSIPVHVTLISADTWSATWEEPIGGSPAQVTANAGRTLPIKVRLYRNGVEVVTGAAFLRLVPCNATGPAIDVPLTYGGRWTGKIDTSMLSGDCFHVSAIVGTVEVGWFQLDISGATPAKQPNKGANTQTP